MMLRWGLFSRGRSTWFGAYLKCPLNHFKISTIFCYLLPYKILSHITYCFSSRHGTSSVGSYFQYFSQFYNWALPFLNAAYQDEGVSASYSLPLLLIDCDFARLSVNCFEIQGVRSSHDHMKSWTFGVVVSLKKENPQFSELHGASIKQHLNATRLAQCSHRTHRDHGVRMDVLCIVVR